MAAPEIVETLVARFDRNRELYCGSGYNETQLRREFLDPFFEALGWDVDNKRGVSPLYQDVVHEYGTEVEGSQKTADYAFRVGEKVKFFVEAKKPGTRLKDDAGPALQLRRYAYSAGLPLSILTDFEEFAAYDGRVPPKKADAASRARVMYFTYDQYVEAWEEIAAVFSREAVWSGAFDTYAEKTRGGKAEPVDKAFLKLLEGWRDELARNVANRNREKDLDKYELSAAVQAILDRIIFLRVAEDRGIEDRGRLEALQKGERVYGRLMELCLEADDVYNSGLFHFRDEKGRATSRDELTPTLHVDDPILRKIIRELSESPYEFGVVPVEILGQVYEQFLGKTISLDGRGVLIDYKPEVRKAKGVYYTPQYIVEYIVKNTVGELLKGCKRPKDAAKLKILDPACGSGSFLLGAYQHLVNWHLEWYVDDGPAKHEGKVVPTPGPGPVSWRLTAAAKKDILVQSLFGVDIDPQAVEVTKLSLLLKALEGESRESVGAQTKFLRERILPDLGDNIKCGNSLIASDYWDFVRGRDRVGAQGLAPLQYEIPEEERRRVNPFDWDVEFAEIMKAGGFDAVIGNPPYGADFSKAEKSYIKDFYKSYKYRYDSYIYFVEKGIMLCKSRGYVSFITPELWLKLTNCAPVRRIISEKGSLKVIRVFGEDVFESAVVNTVVFVFENDVATDAIRVLYGGQEFKLPTVTWRESENLEIDYRLNPRTRGLIVKIGNAALKTLSEFGEVIQGITPYDRYRGQKPAIIKNRAYHFDHEYDKTCGKWLAGKDISRYDLSWSGEWISYGPWLAAPRDPSFFIGERILFREVPGKFKRIQAVIVSDKYYHGHSITPFKPYDSNRINVGYFLGIVNSILMSWYGGLTLPNFGKDIFPKMNPQDIKAIPLRDIDFSVPADATRHDKMVALVEEMLELHKRLAAAKTAADKQRLERAINATDRKIDKLVYKLYGLTGEEIKIVEGS